jgi:hypothetical protein
MSKSDYNAAKRAEPSFSVRRFLDKLANNFMRWYEPGQGLSGDESYFDFKGHHIARSYNPYKPAKWHFKAFFLKDSRSSYLLNFYMYQGKDEERPAIYKATECLIVKLLAPLMFHHKGHILATDNWYISL